MDWKLEAESSVGNCLYRGIRVLQQVGYAANIETMAAALPDLFDGTEQFTWRREGDTNPDQIIIYDPVENQLLFASLGVAKREHAAHIAAGWYEGPAVHDPFPQPYLNDAQSVLASIPRPPSGRFLKAIFLGHSWGGAIARALAWEVKTRYPCDVRIHYSYGSPKYDTVRYYDIDVSTVLTRRVMAPLDVVPGSPPRVQGLGAVAIPLSTETINRLNQQCQGPGGLAFDASGTLVPSVHETGPLADFTIADLTSLLFSPHVFTNAAHELSKYSQLLAPFNISSGPARHVPNFVGVEADIEPQMTPAPVRPREWRDTTEEIKVAQATAVTMNENMAVSSPQRVRDYAADSNTITPLVKFRMSRIQGRRCVKYGTSLVAMTKTRRNTRALKNYLNAQFGLV